MPFILTNVAKTSYVADPITKDVHGFFEALEQITVDFDGARDTIYFGASTLPKLTIPKDKKPMVNLKGPEMPLHLAEYLLGLKTTKATVAEPIPYPTAQQASIGPDGKVKLGVPISATVTKVDVRARLDNKKFTPAATSPTAGQFLQPIAGATELQFNVSDAGTQVFVAYTTDTTEGAKLEYGEDSEPSVIRFVAVGECINTADPTKKPFPATIIVAICQFTGKWAWDEQRQKASQSSLDLSVMDPGFGDAAITIIPTKYIA